MAKFLLKLTSIMVVFMIMCYVINFAVNFISITTSSLLVMAAILGMAIIFNVGILLIRKILNSK